MNIYSFLLISLILLTVNTNVCGQAIQSEEKTIFINNAPSLKIKKIKFVDKNNNNIAETNEKCYFELYLKNDGKSRAKKINIETNITAGNTSGLNFENSVYFGNLDIGEERKIEIPFSSEPGIKSGISNFSFIALEANNYNSAPNNIDVKFKSRELQLAVNWDTPSQFISKVYQPVYKLKACIYSSKPLEKIAVYSNNKKIYDEYQFQSTNPTNCSYKLERDITLEKGKNTILITAKNESERIESEERVIELSEPINEKRLALVIGNSKYGNAPLKNPANDAKAMAKTLKNLNFDVIEIIDGTKKNMRNGIRNFYSQLKTKGCIGLFYYAGHGIQVKGENYIIPVDHDIQEEFDIQDESIRIGNILDHMQNSNSRMNIVILDACRDNPFARSTRSGTRGLAQSYTEGSGSIIAYATAPGRTASDGAGENGLYTQELLKAINTPGLEIGMVFRRVLANVKKISDGKQLPWTNSSLEGEFYFIP